MASKTQSNNENIQNIQQLIKNSDSSRKHVTKKQVFGEIKNVIHNQENATPLKQDPLSNRSQSFKYLAPTLLGNKKNESKNINKNKSPTPTYLSDSVLDEINFLDYFDFRGKCCSNPDKSVQQIWSEMNLYDDSFVNNIIASHQQQESESVREICSNNDNDPEPELLNKFKNNYNYWPDVNDFKGNSDINLYLEKPVILHNINF